MASSLPLTACCSTRGHASQAQKKKRKEKERKKENSQPELGNHQLEAAEHVVVRVHVDAGAGVHADEEGEIEGAAGDGNGVLH